MTAYNKINGEAKIFSRPTTHIKVADLNKLLDECEEKLPETIRYPEPTEAHDC